MNAVSTSVNAQNDHSLTRSRMAPDTIDAAVATKSIWKNQADIDACPLATISSMRPVAPSNSAASAPVGPWSSWNLPTMSPTSRYMRL